jgi:hypothetical protein
VALKWLGFIRSMKRTGPFPFLCAATCLAAVNVLHGATFNVPPPAALSIALGASGAKITYRGATNFQFLLEVSSDLTGWSLLASNVATNAVMTFLDAPAMDQRARYYQAVSLKTPFLYQGTFSGGQRGGFLLLARTNNRATFFAVNTTSATWRGEYTNGLALAEDGAACGSYLASAPGCLSLTPTNTILGRFTNSAQVVGTLTGVQKANSGVFSGAAGLYSGPILGSYPGSAKVLLCPDGTLAFYRSGSSSPPLEGQVSSMKIDGIVDFYLQTGLYPHITGQFAAAARTFSLTIHEKGGLVSTVNLTLNEPLF